MCKYYSQKHMRHLRDQGCAFDPYSLINIVLGIGTKTTSFILAGANCLSRLVSSIKEALGTLTSNTRILAMLATNVTPRYISNGPSSISLEMCDLSVQVRYKTGTPSHPLEELIQ